MIIHNKTAKIISIDVKYQFHFNSVNVYLMFILYKNFRFVVWDFQSRQEVRHRLDSEGFLWISLKTLNIYIKKIEDKMYFTSNGNCIYTSRRISINDKTI